MKRFVNLVAMVGAFVAGIAFVFSCGSGGGSRVLAEITDVTGIESCLTMIDNTLNSIKTSLDSVDSDLAALNTSNGAEREVFSILVHVPVSGVAEVLNVPADKKLVITDLRNISSLNHVQLKEPSDIWYRYTIDPDEVTHFNTGIVYGPGEIVSVQHSATAEFASSVWLSGYYL